MRYQYFYAPQCFLSRAARLQADAEAQKSSGVIDKLFGNVEAAPILTIGSGRTTNPLAGFDASHSGRFSAVFSSPRFRPQFPRNNRSGASRSERFPRLLSVAEAPQRSASSESGQRLLLHQFGHRPGRLRRREKLAANTASTRENFLLISERQVKRAAEYEPMPWLAIRENWRTLSASKTAGRSQLSRKCTHGGHFPVRTT
jgi:hypothetical protein